MLLTHLNSFCNVYIFDYKLLSTSFNLFKASVNKTNNSLIKFKSLTSYVYYIATSEN